MPEGSGPAELGDLIRELARINSELLTRQRTAERTALDAEAGRREITEFVAMVAHDLAGPVQAIRGFAELLIDDPELNPLQRDHATRIERSAQFLGSLIGELSLGMAEEELELLPVDLRELLDSVAARHRLLSAARGMEIVVAGIPEDPAGTMVRGDVVKLERVLNNLVGNAVKFSPERTTVTLTCQQRAGSVVVSVSDQGPGIDPEHQQSVFGMFDRGPDPSGTPGFGLGLYISREIAVKHGGTLELESRPGEGATFRLSIPAAPVDPGAR